MGTVWTQGYFITVPHTHFRGVKIQKISPSKPCAFLKILTSILLFAVQLLNSVAKIYISQHIKVNKSSEFLSY